MKISFVLPVYNCQDKVADCLNSLIRQRKKGEIIVLDDGSTDGTKRIVEAVIARNRRADIKFLSYPERKGAAVRRNFGNRQASGDIIAVCDADIYYKDRSDAILEFFKKHPEYDMFYSALDIRSSKDPDMRGKQDAYTWDFNSKCNISHPTMAYRKSGLNRIKYHEGFIDSDLFEFMLLDAHKSGLKFYGCQNPLMLKTEGDSKRNTSNSYAKKKEMYLKYGITIEGM